MSINCEACGTPLCDINEPCPNCLPHMAWRPSTCGPSQEERYERIIRDRHITDLSVRLTELVAAAEAAFDFTHHPYHCHKYAHMPCNCGLQDALDQLTSAIAAAKEVLK
jgi:hypothetical protein